MNAPTINSAGTPFLLLPVGIRSTVQLSTFRHPLHVAIEEQCVVTHAHVLLLCSATDVSSLNIRNVHV